MPRRIRTPNCTHLNMNRAYGWHQQCDVCGRSPSIGFLYECRQDYDGPSLHDLLAEEDDDSGEVVKSDVRVQLQWLGLSESIIASAEQGHYTVAQLEKLKTQKTDLRQIISDSLQASQTNNAAAKLAALAHAPSNHDGASNSAAIKDLVRQHEIWPANNRPCPLFSQPVYLIRLPNAEPESATLHTQSLSHLSPLLPRPRIHLLPVRLQCRLSTCDSQGC
jgi:hypothetical protein